MATTSAAASARLLEFLTDHPQERRSFGVRRLTLDLEINRFAALASPTTLFTIIVGSWLCRLANWKGWIRVRTDSSGVRRAFRPVLGAMDWVTGVTLG
jgi:hypothetical protein